MKLVFFVSSSHFSVSLFLSGSDNLLSWLQLCFSVTECNMLGAIKKDCHHRPTDYMGPQSIGKELSLPWWSKSTAVSQPTSKAHSQLGNLLVSQSSQSVSQSVGQRASQSISQQNCRQVYQSHHWLSLCNASLPWGEWMRVEVVYHDHYEIVPPLWCRERSSHVLTWGFLKETRSWNREEEKEERVRTSW